MTAAQKPPTPDGPGRPLKLNSDRIERVFTALRAGNFEGASFRLAGLGESTGFNYLKAGRDLLREIDRDLDEVHFPLADTPPDDHPAAALAIEERLLVAFVHAVDEGIAQSEARLVTNWSIAAEEDWRAAAELLARRFPRWQRRETRVLEGNAEHPLRVQDARFAEQIQSDPDALDLALELLAAVASQDVDEGGDPEDESREDVEKVKAINRGDYGE